MSRPLDEDVDPVTGKTEEEQKDIDLTLTEEEEAALKKRLEELRKRDPFIYR